MSGPFAVKWGVKCADCGDWVSPGQLARFADGNLVHDNCETVPDPLAVTSTVCPVCWLTTPCEHAP